MRTTVGESRRTFIARLSIGGALYELDDERPDDDYFKAYQEGDRFYILFPQSDISEGDIPFPTRFLYTDLRGDQRGDDALISLRLQSGAKARVQRERDGLYLIIVGPTPESWR